MKTDSRIYEHVGEVLRLNLVGGKENTPTWEDTVDVPYLEVTLSGIEMALGIVDRHHGRTRIVRGYQLNGGWEKRDVRNERQVSVATLQDLQALAEQLDLADAIRGSGNDLVGFMSESLGVNLVLGGDNLTPLLGPGAKLLIGEPETGAIIDISEAHLPCKKPALAIARALDMDPEILKTTFKSVAAERRGFMASVFSAGRICTGDQVSIQPPIDHRLERATWRS